MGHVAKDCTHVVEEIRGRQESELPYGNFLRMGAKLGGGERKAENSNRVQACKYLGSGGGVLAEEGVCQNMRADELTRLVAPHEVNDEEMGREEECNGLLSSDMDNGPGIAGKAGEDIWRGNIPEVVQTLEPSEIIPAEQCGVMDGIGAYPMVNIPIAISKTMREAMLGNGSWCVESFGQHGALGVCQTAAPRGGNLMQGTRKGKPKWKRRARSSPSCEVSDSAVSPVDCNIGIGSGIGLKRLVGWEENQRKRRRVAMLDVAVPTQNVAGAERMPQPCLD